MEIYKFIIIYFASKDVSLLTAFVCWNPEDVLELWRAARLGGVRLSVQRCDAPRASLHAYGVPREGVLLDTNCPYAHQILNMASKRRAFIHRYSWLLLQRGSLNESALESVLGETAVLPDADVTWAAQDELLDVYRVKATEPLVLTSLGVRRDVTRRTLDTLWASLPSAVVRRKHLQNIFISAATIITFPEVFKGWQDLTNRHVDTFPKLTYPLCLLLAEDLHFKYDMRQVEIYGVEQNSSFDGLAGLLQRGEVEIGAASIFMRADRWKVMHFCSETVELKGAFIFRQPAQSAVSNMFLLPFSRGVWMACGGVMLAAGGVLLLLVRAVNNPDGADDTLQRLTLVETLTFVIGTICQQGFYMTPQLVSVRVAMLFTFLMSLFAFTAYSAKIVAILQTPSDAIQTIQDLTHSPMSMGVQETTYKKTYFAESSDPATQQLYRRKLLPLGERAYMTVVEGVARLRRGLFAFQVEQSAGYDIISQTFTEREKCGLKEIQAFKLPMVAVPIQRHSGYRDLIGTRLRWQRETGLMERWRRLWLAGRVRCDAGAGGFVSVGLSDVLPAARALLAGAAAAATLLLLEVLLHNYHHRLTRSRAQAPRLP